ncbi:MAG: hypothetical protein IKQ72_07970 [Bacteroidaceae bacterium]|nr:hypothetical protein [Bacteroidaceae bacterium]
MTEEEKLQIKSFEAKVQQLIASYSALKKENEALLTTIVEKDKEILNLKTIAEQRKADYDNLKIARIISVSDKDKKEAKLRITNMVRTVNKCISILTSEGESLSEEEIISAGGTVSKEEITKDETQVKDETNMRLTTDSDETINSNESSFNFEENTNQEEENISEEYKSHEESIATEESMTSAIDESDANQAETIDFAVEESSATANSIDATETTTKATTVEKKNANGGAYYNGGLFSDEEFLDDKDQADSDDASTEDNK